MFVALLGSAKRDLKLGARGDTWVVRVELGLLMACFDSIRHGIRVFFSKY